MNMSYPDWIETVPDRARDVIEGGPVPASEFGSITANEKICGLSADRVYTENKTGTIGRPRKVVFFNPSWAFDLDESTVPDEIRQLHDETRVAQLAEWLNE